VNFAEAAAAVRAGTPPAEAARAVVAAMTPEERLWCLDGDEPCWAGLEHLGRGGYHEAPFPAARVERLGVPGFAFADGPRGCALGNATCFPVAMGRGATWDPDLEEQVGEAIGRELRAAGATLTGAVFVNLLRHPAWGRAQETYGEDPYHVGEMAAAATRGLQRHVMACVKHLACNSMEDARFTVDVRVDEVALHEVYLPAFRRVVDEGVAAVMSAYNAVNGEWCGQHRGLLTDVLRGEWGFEGFVISDWIFGIRDAARSVAAGLDVEMPYRMVRAARLPAALERGEASWADVDRAVTRLVATLLRFDDVRSAPAPARETLGAAAHRTLARQVAARAVVLLRNDPVGGRPVLPLAGGERVALLGRLAAVVNLGDRGSSDVWDLDCRTVLDGFVEAGLAVTHEDGTDLDRAAAAAGAADVAVVVVGCTADDEGEFIGEVGPELAALLPGPDDPALVEAFRTMVAARPIAARPAHLEPGPAGFGRGGDRRSLRLRPQDAALVRAAVRANPRTVVALVSGGPIIPTDWVDEVPAALQAWYGGCRAGPGLVDVLTGAVEPSGRLPCTVPADEAHLPPFATEATTFTYDRWHGWWRHRRLGHPPAFPFGFGLAYTTFALTDAAVRRDPETLVVRGRVANTGARDGVDVVQVYAGLPGPDAPDRLVGFARVEVPAGGEVPFELAVPTRRLDRRDPDAGRWLPARGPHRITVARHAADPDARSVAVEL
jgi:beta-glucosidase-like glycosyl hydrolase